MNECSRANGRSPDVSRRGWRISLSERVDEFCGEHLVQNTLTTDEIVRAGLCIGCGLCVGVIGV